MPDPKKLLLPVVALLAAALPGAAQKGKTLRDLLDTVANRGDESPAGLFEKIARHKTDKALDTSIKAVNYLRKEGLLNAAYNSFRHYKDAGAEVSAAAREFVVDDAKGHRRVQNQRAAARSLSHWGAAVHADLLEIAEKSRDDGHRRAAVDLVLPVLAERGDRDSLLLILDNASVSGARAKAVREALMAFTGDRWLELFYRKMQDRSTSAPWRQVLLDRLLADESDEVFDYLIELLRSEDTAVQFRAAVALGEQRREGAAKALWKLLRSDDSAVLHATIVALGRIMGADDKWQERLFDLAGHKDPIARMGAAISLAELRTADAKEVLHGMLADSDRRVRIEAVQQVGNLRRKESVPILIERLEQEEGRIRQDIARVLRLVTGLDHGMSRSRWKAWWDAEGAGFALPTYAQAAAAEKERIDRRRSNESIATFYGLQVVSDRVCFILDTSGSMATAAKPRPGRTSSREGAGTTRLTVAQDELARTLTAFPDGDSFNVVFFESVVRRWSNELQEMDPRQREDALGFVQAQKAAGGTALFDALVIAMEDELVDTIYVLTDGDPSAGRITDPPQLRAEIARMNATRKVQINTIAIGQSSPLLRGLAADSGGEYREVK